MRALPIGGCVAFAALSIACGGAGRPPGGSGGTAAADKPARYSPFINDVATVHTGGQLVAICSDTDTLDALVTASEQGQKQLVTNLIARRKAFTVPSGSSVRVLDVNLFTVQVLVLEGKHASETGYVYKDWLQPGGGTVR